MSTDNVSSLAPTSHNLFIQTKKDHYTLSEPVTKDQMYQLMLEMLEENTFRADQLTSPDKTRQYLKIKLGKLQHEVFSIIFMDSQNRVIAYEELFRGTIDGAAVYPREVVKRCLHHNAATVILAHNHPSGDSTPSSADIEITQRLKKALLLVDTRVLDHLIVGQSITSLAEKGYL